MNKTIWFAGTTDFSAQLLQFLLKETQYQITAVFTQPDRPSGRGKKITASPVKILAEDHHIPIFQPVSFKDDLSFNEIKRPDLCIVVAYGLLLPQSFLSYPTLGCINIHTSLLPKWRGAAPIQRAIENGDKQTGVSIMQMDQGLDTGDVWIKKETCITNSDDANTLSDKLLTLSKVALLETFDLIFKTQNKPTPQENELASYAHKLNKQEAKINWQESAEIIERKIRAFNPVPVAHTALDEQNIKIFRAHIIHIENNSPAGTIFRQDKTGIYVTTGQDALCIEELQLPGKKKVHAKEIINGHNWIGKKFS